MMLLEENIGTNLRDCSADWQDYLSREASNHPLFRRRQLGVVGGKGCVVLTGRVTSFYEKQVAQEFVRRCDGVRQIDNRIEVAYAREPLTGQP